LGGGGGAVAPRGGRNKTNPGPGVGERGEFGTGTGAKKTGFRGGLSKGEFGVGKGGVLGKCGGDRVTGDGGAQGLGDGTRWQKGLGEIGSGGQKAGGR